MEVKGTVIYSIAKSINDKYGKYGLKRWLELISPEARRVYSSKVDTEAWYPLKEILIEPTANIAQLFFEWDLKAAAWTFGRYSAEARFKGLLKIAVKVGSPNFFLNKAGEYLPSYYRPCAIEVPVNEPKHALMRVTHFPGMDKTTEFRICGWTERALEIGGCKKITVDIIKSLTNFQSVSEYEVRWK